MVTFTNDELMQMVALIAKESDNIIENAKPNDILKATILKCRGISKVDVRDDGWSVNVEPFRVIGETC